jgi:putative membrane protein
MKSSNRIAMAAALTGLLAAAPAAFAQSGGMTSGSMSKTTTTKTMTTTTSKMSAADSKFIKEAAVGGMEEVTLGQLAAQKATDPDVKNFGQKMVDDHSKANDQLKQLAAQKGVTVASALPPSKQKDVDQLSKLSGAAFDKKYVSMMVSDHKKDVAEFKKESAKAKDSDLKSWAGATLPTLQDHLKMIEDISAKMHPTKMSKKGK